MIKAIFYILFYTLIFSYFFTVFINPGIPEKKYYLNEYKTDDSEKFIKCKLCNINVPKELNIGHCTECNICIIKYDHHCKWAGKCIGKGNILFFYFFCLSLFGYIIFIIIFLFLYNKFRSNLI